MRLMCDKAFVARHSGERGPFFSRSPSIRAREKAMVISLEFVRVIVTADEVLPLEPLVQEVLPFVEKLRRQFPLKSLEVDFGSGHANNQDGKLAQHVSCVNEAAGAERELPFELQVRRYIVDKEDYVNTQLDSKRNELIRLQLALTIASFGITINTFIAAAFAMNIPHNGSHDLAAGGPLGHLSGPPHLSACWSSSCCSDMPGGTGYSALEHEPAIMKVIDILLHNAS